MGYKKRKLKIIEKFLTPSLILDARKVFSRKDGKTSKDEETEIRLGKNLRLLFENLGPVFIKFGQLLSTRRDIFPENIISELEKLQDDVKEEDFSHIKEVIEDEFKKDMGEIFYDFDKKPLATGSIAQTHLAYIKIGSSKKKVVLKVQRKGIGKRVKEDLEIMTDLYKRLEKRIKLIKSFNLGEIIEEFSKSMQDEIDFEKEMENIKKYKSLNILKDDLKAPKVYEEFCKKKVLCMEYIDGKSIRSIYNKGPDKRKKIGERIIRAYANQIFSYGFFHADPHPGNIFVKKDLEIYLIDFGIVENLSENYRYEIMKIFLGASFNEVKMITDAIIGMGMLEFDSKKISSFEKRVQKLLDKYMTMSLNQMRLRDLIKDFYALLVDYSIKIPSELTNFAKTVFTLEGLIEKLVYKESFIELSLPIARSMVFKFLDPNLLVDRLRPKFYDSFTLIKEFPQASLNILRQLVSGDFRLINEKSIKERKSYERAEDKKSQGLIFLGLSIIVAVSIIGLINLGYRTNIMEAFLIILLAISLTSALAIFINIFKRS